MPYRRYWIDTRGLPPWRPEAQAAGSRGGYWVESYEPSGADLLARAKQEATKQATIEKVRASEDPTVIADLLRHHDSFLQGESAALNHGFGVLAKSGRLGAATHALYRLHLAFPQRLFDWHVIKVASSAHDRAWQTETGRFITADGHAWCATHGSGSDMSEDLLAGHIPTAYGRLWAGPGTAKQATVAVPVGEEPRIIHDSTVHRTRKRIERGAVVQDCSGVWLSEIRKLMSRR